MSQKGKKHKKPRINHADHGHSLDPTGYGACRRHMQQYGTPLIVRDGEPVPPEATPSPPRVELDPGSDLVRHAAIVRGAMREAREQPPVAPPLSPPESTPLPPVSNVGMGLDTMRALIESLENIEGYVSERGSLEAASLSLVIDDLNVTAEFDPAQGWGVRVR